MVCRELLVVSVISIAVFFAPASRAEVLIGLATPLSGAESAVADLNAKGGVLGERIELTVVDDACDAEQAVAAAEKLVDAGVALDIGHRCSIASIPASTVYAEAGVLMISHFSTNPKLTEQGFSTVFRLSGRDDVQGRVAGDLLAERFGRKSIAIIHDSEVYGQGLAELTKRRLNERGVAEVMFEGIEPGQAEYSDLVRRMQTRDVEVLYYGGFRREAGLIARHAHDQGYDLQLVAGDGIGGEDFALIAGPAAAVDEAYALGELDYSALVSKMQAAGVDVLFVGGYHQETGLMFRQAHDRGYDARLIASSAVATADFPLIAGPGLDGTLMVAAADMRTSPQAADVVARFRAQGYEPQGYTLNSYAVVQVWAQAVTAAGSLDFDAVTEILHSRQFDTVLGRIGFDEKGDVTGIDPWQWYVWKEGDYGPAAGLSN